MFRTAVGRRRRALWAILSCLFAAGFAVSAFMVHSEGNQGLESVVERARDEAQLATATLSGKELTKPVTGSTYDRLAAKIWKSVSSEGSISGVTIWSSRGRIIFSLNESRVGSAPAEMRSLITGIAEGSGSTRVLDGTVQTFTRISKAGSVAISVISDCISAGVFPTRDSFSEKMIRPREDQMVTPAMDPSDETDFQILAASRS